MLSLRSTLLASLVGAALSVPPTVINADTFTDTNGTVLTSHTPSTGAASWIFYASTGLEIQSNKVAQQFSQEHTAAMDTGDADVRITIDVDVPNVNDWAAAVWFRIESSSARNDGFMIQASRTSGGTPNCDLNDFVSSTPTQLDTDTMGAVSGTTITFTVDTNGTSISGSCGGATSVSATSSNHQTATIHGFGSYGIAPYSTSVTFDNWSVDDTPGGGGGPASFVPALVNNRRGGGLLAQVKGWFPHVEVW